MQTLESAIASMQASTKSNIVAKDKKQEPTFHEKELVKMYENPKNTLREAALDQGKKMADEFMKTVFDMKHKDHEKNFARFKNDFEMNVDRARKTIVEDFCDSLNAHPYEKKDPAYEKQVLDKYKPMNKNASIEALKFYNGFVDSMHAKWNREGYRGDAGYVGALVDKYCLQPNEHIQNLRDFRPKK